MKLFVSLMALSLGTTVYAANGSKSAADNFHIDGKITTHVRSLDRDDGDTWRLSTILKASYALGECDELRGQLRTGSKFDSADDKTGILDGERKGHFQATQFYYNHDCGGRFFGSVGAMNIENGPMSFSSKGYQDGIRVGVREENSGRVWTVTVSNIDNLKDPDLFDRDYGDFNFKEIAVEQPFGEEGDHKLMIGVADFDDVELVRAGIRVGLSRYAEWMDSLDAQAAYADGDKIGDNISFNFHVGENRFGIYTTDMEYKPMGLEQWTKLFSSQRGKGRNYGAQWQRDLPFVDDFLARVRTGDDDNMYVIQATWKLGKKKKKKSYATPQSTYPSKEDFSVIE